MQNALESASFNAARLIEMSKARGRGVLGRGTQEVTGRGHLIWMRKTGAWRCRGREFSVIKKRGSLHRHLQPLAAAQ